jgi:hypothetical protein
MNNPENNQRNLGFTDLTLNELWDLVKTFFTAVLGCLLIFGLPWACVIGLDSLGRSNLSASEYSWWEQIFQWGFYALVVSFILWNIPEILKAFGEFFTSLSTTAQNLSRTKQILLFIFVYGYFALCIKLPDYAFFFSILVLIPGGYTFQVYKELLKRRSATSESHPYSHRH